MTKRWIRYTAAELSWVEANRALQRVELHAGFQEAFNRPEVTLAHLVALRKRKGWKTGRDGRFPKGAVPPNKGRFGYHSPGAEKGWFKKGGRTGKAKDIYKPIGTERIDNGGYLQRKVNDDLPLQRRWRFVHVIRWEEANGPTPEGYALKCLDGNRQNTEPSNWEAVPRAILPRLAGGFRKRHIAYDHAPAELRPALLAVAKLEHKVREARGTSRDEANAPPRSTTTTPSG
jgi:hypothetical protein